MSELGQKSKAAESLRKVLKKIAPLGDAELLALYINRSDSEAFAELVDRYGPLIMGIARRHCSVADADDVFQTTFALLARDAAKIRQRDNLAGWLYRIAFRTAKKKARRKFPTLIELEREDPNAIDPSLVASWREVAAAVDAELLRLPEEIRSPLIVCFLQGHTQEEAARRLGLCLNTFRRRLDRGRELLRIRLEKRGLAPAMLAVAAMPASIALATVPPNLMTIVSGFAAGGTISPVALSLLSHAVFPMKAISLAAVCMLGLGLTAFYSASASLEKPLPLPILVEETISSVENANDEADDDDDDQDKVDQADNARNPLVMRNDTLGDLLPPRALQRFGTTRLSHPGNVHGMALSCDGKTLVTVAHGNLLFWDAETGKQIRQDRCGFEFEYGIYCTRPMTPHPNNKSFLIVSQGEVLNVEPGEPFHHMRHFSGHEAPIRTVHLSKDGKRMALGSASGVTIHDYPDGKMLHKFKNTLVQDENKDESMYLTHALAEISPDGKRVIINAEVPCDTIRICDADNGKDIEKITLDSFVVQVSYSPDGSQFALSLTDGTLNFFDAKTLKKTQTWKLPIKDKQHSGATALSFSPDGKKIAVGTGGDRWVRLYEVATGKELHKLTDDQWLVLSLAFSPDGNTLYSVGAYSSVKRWDVASGKIKPLAIDALNGGIAQSPNGKLVAYGGESGLIRICESPSGKVIASLDNGGGADSMTFSPDSKLLAIALGHDIQLWDWAAGKKLRSGTWPVRKSIHDSADHLQFSPDGKYLGAFVFRQHKAFVWDVDTLQNRRNYNHKEVFDMSFSADSKSLVTVGWNSTIRITDLGANAPRLSYSFNPDDPKYVDRDMRVVSCACSPDGRTIATGHMDGTVLLWDPRDLKIRKQIQQKGNGSYCYVSFSSSGAWLAVAGYHQVDLWESATGSKVTAFLGHEADVLSGRFDNCGKTLLSVSRDHTALLWDTRPKALPKIGEALWADLRSDAKTAYAAQWAAVDNPKESLAFLEKQLPPAKIDFDRKSVLKRIDELDSDQFRTRESADKSLRELGTLALPLLKEAKPKSAEQKDRIEKLIKASFLEGAELSPENRRVLRTVQAVEQAGGPDAKKVLQVWSEGTKGAFLTELAKEALGRVK